MEKESDWSYVNRLSEELLMIPIEYKNEWAININSHYYSLYVTTTYVYIHDNPNVL